MSVFTRADKFDKQLHSVSVARHIHCVIFVFNLTYINIPHLWQLKGIVWFGINDLDTNKTKFSYILF